MVVTLIDIHHVTQALQGTLHNVGILSTFLPPNSPHQNFAEELFNNVKYYQ